jgi:hypothetical protein
MQAIIGTKSPQLRGLSGCFAKGFATPEGLLFADAETAENLAEQVVGREGAGDFRKSRLGKAQLLGNQL